MSLRCGRRDDRAHGDDKMACFSCHLSWTTSCAGCHLPTRHGGGMVPGLIGIRLRLTDAEVTQLLKTGRNAMPPFAGVLAPEQMRDIATYVVTGLGAQAPR